MSLHHPLPPATVELQQPRLHALVIGVAHYPHLLGGDPAAMARDPLSLGQISTPQHTARAIAGWLTTRYANHACPLGSVELLVSTPGGNADGTEAATADNIENAVGRWFTRCSSHPKNIAFFYYCGHGLEKGAQFLLPEDFGNPAIVDPWKNCIDLDRFRAGLRASLQAEALFCFVDACRETPFSMLTQVNVSGRPLVGGNGFGTALSTNGLYNAAASSRQAYGPATEPTYFAQALLKCLEGVASTNDGTAWVVDANSIDAGLTKMLRYYGDRVGQSLKPQTDVMGSTVLHESGRGLVLASVGCATAQASQCAEIELTRGAVSHRAVMTDPKPFERELAPGDWDVRIRFPNGEFPDSQAMTFTLLPGVWQGVPYP